MITRKKGFTLIELLFVIAIIAVIASLALLTYRHKAQQARIAKAAMQMQEVLEAAMTYYNDKGSWPKANGGVPECADQVPSGNTFVENYLPNGTYGAKSDYGSYFCWAGINGNNKFWVALKVPQDPANPKSAEHIAQRIAAKLPNGIITSQPSVEVGSGIPTCSGTNCYVRAEIPIPGESSNTSGHREVIIGTGDCGSNTQSNGVTSCFSHGNTGTDEYRITFPACSAKQQPRVTVWPNHLSMPGARKPYDGYTITRLNASVLDCSSPTQAGQQSCDVAVSVEYCGYPKCTSYNIKQIGKGGGVGASYVVACAPKYQSQVRY